MELFVLVLVVLLAGFSLLLAVNPLWLDRYLRNDLRRSIDRARAGARNPYINARTEPDRFLRNLRVGATFTFALFIILGIALMWSR